jgi:2-keto-4-pentenoate hydratase/2-oxohepta-3-ene-1,7-dioic acid hydratase in catechol pathway
MKIATFGEDFTVGIVRGDTIIDATPALGEAANLAPDERVIAMIESWDSLRTAFERLERDGSGVPLSSVRLRQPIPRPRKVLACLGNYKEFTERARAPQDMFMQSPESVIGLGDTVTLPPHDAAVYQHEAELVIVIGKRASSLTPLQARSAIFGYTIGCDVSGRGLGKVGTNSRVGKAQPGFKPIGPWIVTTDEISDPHELGIRLSVSDEPRQVYTTDDMEYRVPEVVAFGSGFTTLLPGDIIYCGTNHQGLGPLQDGDHVLIEIDGIGRLEFEVEDPLKRTWTRMIDEEMAARARDAFAAPRDWSTFKR